jgi:dTDP-4-dehydrorhamnose 3,5-epimerase
MNNTFHHSKFGKNFFETLTQFQEPCPQIITKIPFSDDRGFFAENYRESEYHEAGIVDNFKQDNVSFSHKGTFRGLHFQKKPYETSKLVSVLKGEVIDFIVDIRPSSSSYKKWENIYLTESNQRLLYIPQGYAHGFITFSDVIFYYKCSCEYNSSYDGCIKYDDPDINIQFPFDIIKYISEKDKTAPYLKDIEEYYRGFGK